MAHGAPRQPEAASYFANHCSSQSGLKRGLLLHPSDIRSTHLWCEAQRCKKVFGLHRKHGAIWVLPLGAMGVRVVTQLKACHLAKLLPCLLQNFFVCSAQCQQIGWRFSALLIAQCQHMVGTISNPAFPSAGTRFDFTIDQIKCDRHHRAVWHGHQTITDDSFAKLAQCTTLRQVHQLHELEHSQLAACLHEKVGCDLSCLLFVEEGFEHAVIIASCRTSCLILRKQKRIA
jgi:hypothetical protein